MNDTANSSTIIAMKITNGTIVRILIRKLDVNSENRNPPRIFISECPAAILASSRTPSESARAR